jgi:hypothetical protein
MHETIAHDCILKQSCCAVKKSSNNNNTKNSGRRNEEKGVNAVPVAHGTVRKVQADNGDNVLAAAADNGKSQQYYQIILSR